MYEEGTKSKQSLRIERKTPLFCLYKDPYPTHDGIGNSEYFAGKVLLFFQVEHAEKTHQVALIRAYHLYARAMLLAVICYHLQWIHGKLHVFQYHALIGFQHLKYITSVNYLLLPLGMCMLFHTFMEKILAKCI